MKCLIPLFFALLVLMACNDSTNQSVSTPDTITAKIGLLQSFGDDKVIYIDQNEVATIISKSGQVLVKTDLRNATPIPERHKWKSSIPRHSNDTLYASAVFVDDMMYYSYHVEKGRKYNLKPYLGLRAEYVDLPCQSGWIGDVDDSKYYSCSGKVKISLAIWQRVVDEDYLGMSIRE